MRTLDLTKLKRYSEIIEDDHTILNIPITIISNPDYWQKILNELESTANSKGIYIKDKENSPKLMMQSFAQGKAFTLEFIRYESNRNNNSNYEDADIIK